MEYSALTHWGSDKMATILQTTFLNSMFSMSKGFNYLHCFIRPDSRFVPNQWETALLCNNVSHWMGANLESALFMLRDDTEEPL